MQKRFAIMVLAPALLGAAACQERTGDAQNGSDNEPMEGGGIYPAPARSLAATLPATDPAAQATANEAANLAPRGPNTGAAVADPGPAD